MTKILSVGGSIICETKSPDSFSVKSIANEFGENDSTIETKVEKDGKISITSKYLLDALNVMSGTEIFIGFSEGVDKASNMAVPMILKNNGSDDYIHILMPVSI